MYYTALYCTKLCYTIVLNFTALYLTVCHLLVWSGNQFLVITGEEIPNPGEGAGRGAGEGEDKAGE